MEESLLNVSNAIRNRRSCMLTIRCWIVNYTATNAFPHKFFYPGCGVLRPNGTFCARSSCDQHVKSRGSSRLIYRFQLQLTDRSQSPPLIVTIFDAAEKLIGIPASQLGVKSPELQKEMVREATSAVLEFDICLRVKADVFTGDFVAIVQMLHLVETVEDEVLKELMGSPSPSPHIARSSGDFHTPRGEESGTGGSSGGSSHRSGTRSQARSSRLSSVKTKLKDVLDIIDLTIDD